MFVCVGISVRMCSWCMCVGVEVCVCVCFDKYLLHVIFQSIYLLSTVNINLPLHM